MSRRITTTALIAMLAVVAGTAGWSWWRAHHPSPATPQCNVPASLSSAVAAPNPASGGIIVVEKGFTQQARSRGSSSQGVSLGAILQNTSDQVAYRTRITFRVYDAQHHDIARPKSLQLIQEVPILLPGQRIGVGAFTYLTADTLPRPQVTAYSFDVQPSATRWLPAATLGGYSSINTTYVSMTRNGTDPGQPTINLTATSANCQPLHPRGAAVIYRNGTGGIVGGDEGSPRDDDDRICQPGTASAHLDVTADAPATEVDARTEAYAYCDFEPKPFGADTPWN